MAEQYTWQCFSADGPSESVMTGWRMLLTLPPVAQQNLWHLIPVGLLEPDPPEHRQIVESYATRFDANPAHVLGAVRTCQFFLRTAAARKLETEAVMADLRVMSQGSTAGVELLAPHFDELRDRLRLRLLEDTLADHGNVLVGFDWRIDNVSSSNHGEMEGVPVVFMNLVYRHGDDKHKLAMQLTPSAIASLKAFFSRFETE
jgi:hypothetical protein